MFTEKELEIAYKVADELCHIDSEVVFTSILGLAIDQWTATTGRSYEEAHEMLEGLLVAHEGVNEMLGRMVV